MCRGVAPPLSGAADADAVTVAGAGAGASGADGAGAGARAAGAGAVGAEGLHWTAGGAGITVVTPTQTSPNGVAIRISKPRFLPWPKGHESSQEWYDQQLILILYVVI